MSIGVLRTFSDEHSHTVARTKRNERLETNAVARDELKRKSLADGSKHKGGFQFVK